MYGSLFSTTFAQNILCCDKYVASDAPDAGRAHTGLNAKCPLFLFNITLNRKCQQTVLKLTNIIFNDDLFSGSHTQTK
jgi:hypothetical protein